MASMGAASQASAVRADPTDGFLVGASGTAHRPTTSLMDVPPVTPERGPTNERTILFVNGILTGPEKRLESMQELADKTGSRVVGVAARSNGLVHDVSQVALEKMGRGKHPPADTVAKVVYDELRAGHRVDLRGHSRGALVISNALEQVKNRMVLEDGLSRAEAEILLSRVDVTTYARGAGSFPDGPNYTHHLNTNDPIRALLIEAGSPGRGAKSITFDGPGGLEGHRLQAYLAAPTASR